MAGEEWSVSLQTAFIGALKDAPGKEQQYVGGRIYDEPPRDPVYPFIRIGNIDITSEDTDDTLGAQFKFSLEVHTRGVGQVMGKSIIEEVARDFHRGERQLQQYMPAPILVTELRHQTTNASRGRDAQNWVAVGLFTGSLDTAANYPDPPRIPVVWTTPNLANYHLAVTGGVYFNFQSAPPDPFPADWISGGAEGRLAYIFMSVNDGNRFYVGIHERRSEDNRVVYFTDQAINNMLFSFSLPEATDPAGNPYCEFYSDAENYSSDQIRPTAYTARSVAELGAWITMVAEYPTAEWNNATLTFTW